MTGLGDGDGGLPRSYLRPCLLLLLGGGPSHGYELLDQVRGMGLRVAEPGGLYRTLRAMEHDGLVRSWWEPSQSGPARRTYAVTDPGRAELAGTVAQLRQVVTLVEAMVARYARLPEPRGGRR